MRFLAPSGSMQHAGCMQPPLRLEPASFKRKKSYVIYHDLPIHIVQKICDMGNGMIIIIIMVRTVAWLKGRR